MREPIREFVEIVAQTLDLPGPIYEFGSLQVSGNEPMEDLRPIFPDTTYIGCDMREGPGVDKVLDLHAIELESECAGTVITMDTMEHVEYPRKAIDEIHRILAADGCLIMSSVMKFPIHAYPNDFWRFTPEGFRSLLKPFRHQFVGSFGESPEFPHSIVGLGFKGEKPNLDKFEALYKKWAHRYNCICKTLADQPMKPG